MAVWTLGDVAKRAATLLDDPSMRRFTAAYLQPHVDQQNDSFMLMLSRMGVQQNEETAIFNVPAKVGDGPFDLTPYFQPGGPLQYLMRPKEVWWKVKGQPNTSYLLSEMTGELDDVQQGNLGCAQWAWKGGVIVTTPSYVDVTLKVYFYALNTQVYDPLDQVMRGIGSLLALQTANFVCSLNNNMTSLGKRLESDLRRDKKAFGNFIQMQNQAQNIYPRGTKRGYAAQLSAGGIPYQ